MVVGGGTKITPACLWTDGCEGVESVAATAPQVPLGYHQIHHSTCEREAPISSHVEGAGDAGCHLGLQQQLGHSTGARLAALSPPDPIGVTAQIEPNVWIVRTQLVICVY